MNAIVVRGAAAAARVGLPVLIGRARTLTQTIFTRNPGAVAGAARRTGIAAVPGKILDGMKNNKMLTALVLLDIGPEAYDLLHQMAAEDEDVAEMVARYGTTIDKVEDKVIPELATQVDEMRDIAACANDLGGLDVLHRLRRVLRMDEEHFVLYDQLRVMREAIR